MVGMHAAFCSGTHSTPLSLCFFENHPNYTPYLGVFFENHPNYTLYLGGFSGKHPNNTPCRHNFFGVKFVLFTDNVYFRKR
ncbi:MAG: hypothetical protein HXO22_03925 [Prevotella sp.]|nr:hypothetical protein [Prevotella sp.]MBF1584896.1 hypothetical protein [Prevotella sp.]